MSVDEPIVGDKPVEIEILNDDDQRKSERESLMVSDNITDTKDVDTINDDINGDINEIESYNNRCINKIDSIDKYYSCKMFEWKAPLILDIIAIIGCLSFTYLLVPVYVILYIIIFRSYIYGIIVLFNLLLIAILKNIFGRKRPHHISNNFNINKGRFEKVLNVETKISDTASFPSGDTSQSCLLGITLGYRFDKIYYLLLIMIPIVMFGRIYYGRHYILDTIFGAIVGIIVAFVGNAVLHDYFNTIIQ